MKNNCSVGIKFQLYKTSSRHLRYYILPIVNNRVLCTLKYVKKKDLRLCILNLIFFFLVALEFEFRA
jgi:hypothetical protein